jgi:hypothetical protein
VVVYNGGQEFKPLPVERPVSLWLSRSEPEQGSRRFRGVPTGGDPVVPDKRDKPEKITLAKSVTDTGIAPYIFFEGAPNFGFANGIVNITLAATRHLIKDGAAFSDIVAVAHLRCNPLAALELRNALDSALLLAAKTEGTAH